MRFKMLACLLIVSISFVETASAAAQAATPAAPGSVTIPAGKAIPLTLISPIKNKSTRIGDAIRAQVAFPVTIGDRLAVPAGTFVEGTVLSINGKRTKSNAGGLQIHFTRLIFANGYTVSLDAVNTTSLLTPDAGLRHTPDAGLPAGIGTGAGIGLLPLALPEPHPMLAQASPLPTPTLPPLPGPPKGFLIGISIAGAVTVAFLIWIVTEGRSSSRNRDYVVYDAGYQFQMATTVPVTVDASQAAAAAAIAVQ